MSTKREILEKKVDDALDELRKAWEENGFLSPTFDKEREWYKHYMVELLLSEEREGKK